MYRSHNGIRLACIHVSLLAVCFGLFIMTGTRSVSSSGDV